MAAPEAAGEIARMERVSDTPRPTTAVETAPNADPALYTILRTFYDSCYSMRKNHLSSPFASAECRCKIL